MFFDFGGCVVKSSHNLFVDLSDWSVFVGGLSKLDVYLGGSSHLVSSYCSNYGEFSSPIPEVIPLQNG